MPPLLHNCNILKEETKFSYSQPRETFPRGSYGGVCPGGGAGRVEVGETVTQKELEQALLLPAK